MFTEARLPSGFRDSPPELVGARRAMVETIRAVYESYGFLPWETPAIEYLDVLGGEWPKAPSGRIA